MRIRLSVLLLLLAATLPRHIFVDSRKELRTKEENRERIIQSGHPLQSNKVYPSRVFQLSWLPRVFLYRGFLADDECDHLISGDDEVISRIEERISTWSFIPKENGKPLQVQHFENEDAKEKYDYFGNMSMLQLTEPVLATVILYLSNVTRGGHIFFPKSKNKLWSGCTKSSQILTPTKGNAIIFFNLHLDATPDDTSSHARCPVIEGEMWTATKVFALHAATGGHASKSDDAECTDEDENCSRWAAMGECKRNPVFMIGSPDYYGTCRKSCNAC